MRIHDAFKEQHQTRIWSSFIWIVSAQKVLLALVKSGLLRVTLLLLLSFLRHSIWRNGFLELAKYIIRNFAERVSWCKAHECNNSSFADSLATSFNLWTQIRITFTKGPYDGVVSVRWFRSGLLSQVGQSRPGPRRPDIPEKYKAFRRVSLDFHYANRTFKKYQHSCYS